jgi:phosphoribosylaminoimidazole carboxylase PurE protein
MPPKPVVGILVGSASDLEVMNAAAETLATLGIPCETVVASAHRTPDAVRAYAREAAARGLQLVICGAGLAAHLAGTVAAHTDLPVIGVPLPGGVADGLDALLSTAQMPRGVPVATVTVGKAGAVNAALLAARILALHDDALRVRLQSFREANAGEKAAEPKQA